MCANTTPTDLELITSFGTPFTVPAMSVVEAPGDFEPVPGTVKLYGEPTDIAELGHTMRLGVTEKDRRRARGKRQRQARRRNRP